MTSSLKGCITPKTLSFEWKIERFFADCETHNESYKSPEWTAPYDEKITKWFLQVYPKGNIEKNKGHISLFLHLNSESEYQVTVDYIFSVMNKEKKLFVKKNRTRKFVGPVDNWGLPNFMEQSALQDPKLSDDTLIILCELTIHPSSQDAEKNSTCYDELLKNIGNGLADYEVLLDNEAFSDVKFNVQDKQINAHKNILSCRSSVFKAMFEYKMKESEQGVVDIVDIDCDVMLELFRFIYSGKVRNIEEMSANLLVAADKYQVIELKALCEKTLFDKLTADNAIEYLKLVDMCDTIHLQRLIIKFVVTHSKQIVVKSGFKDLSKDMMHQIMKDIVMRE